jgi:hypothetical protein
MKAVIIDTFNGEGYSEPTIKVSQLRNSVETLNIINEMRLTYCENKYAESEMKGDNEGDVILFLDAEEDSGSIHIMDLPTPEFYIIQIKPQINEVKFWLKMPTMETALETLSEFIVNSNDFGFDEDDVEDYDGEDFFGSHAEDGEFYYFKIVQG